LKILNFIEIVLNLVNTDASKFRSKIGFKGLGQDFFLNEEY